MEKLATISCGFGAIKGLQFNPQPLKDGHLLLGENDFETSHIFNVREVFYKNQTDSDIIGECIRSMSVRSDSYKLTFVIDKERNVKSGRCSCVAGIDLKCKHSAALYLYINLERTESKTDAPKAWLKPSEKQKKMYRKAKTFKEMFGGVDFNPDYKLKEHRMKRLTELMEKANLKG